MKLTRITHASYMINLMDKDHSFWNAMDIFKGYDKVKFFEYVDTFTMPIGRMKK